MTVVIITLIIGAVLKFGKFNSNSNENIAQTIEYKLEVDNIREYTVDGIKSGDMVYDSQTGVNIGTITNVEVTNAKTYESTSTGETIIVTNPYKYDMVLTIETPGSITESSYYANKTIELKVDSTKTIETKYVKTTGRFIEINEK